MNKRQIKLTSNNRYRQLNKLFKKLTKHFDAETIHRFRVEYKKLRAFLRMLEQHQDGAVKLKITNDLKKVYQLSGAIRDLQLQQQRIAEAAKYRIKKPLAYLKLLDKEIEQLKPLLKKMLERNPVKACKQKTDAVLPDGFPINHFRDFINQKWDAINAIMITGFFSDDHIHSIRKVLKDFFYNLEIYEGPVHEVLSISVWKGKDAVYIDQLLDELGSFQDKCSAIALLKPDWLLQLKAPNRQLLGQIKRDWIHDKMVIKHLLVSKLKTDFKTASSFKIKMK